MALSQVLLAIVCLTGAAYCFEWTNCGDPDGPIQFNTIDLAPSPVVFPGEAIINVDAASLNNIDNFNLDVEITKYLIGVPIPIPCVNDIGSCFYEDVCTLLGTNSTIAQIIIFILDAVGVPTECPVPPFELLLEDVTVPLPTLPGGVAPLVEGRWVFRLDMTEFTTGEQLGCIELDIDVEVL